MVENENNLTEWLHFDMSLTLLKPQKMSFMPNYGFFTGSVTGEETFIKYQELEMYIYEDFHCVMEGNGAG